MSTPIHEVMYHGILALREAGTDSDHIKHVKVSYDAAFTSPFAAPLVHLDLGGVRDARLSCPNRPATVVSDILYTEDIVKVVAWCDECDELAQSVFPRNTTQRGIKVAYQATTALSSGSASDLDNTLTALADAWQGHVDWDRGIYGLMLQVQARRSRQQATSPNFQAEVMGRLVESFANVILWNGPVARRFLSLMVAGIPASTQARPEDVWKDVLGKQVGVAVQDATHWEKLPSLLTERKFPQSPQAVTQLAAVPLERIQGHGTTSDAIQQAWEVTVKETFADLIEEWKAVCATLTGERTHLYVTRRTPRKKPGVNDTHLLDLGVLWGSATSGDVVGVVVPEVVAKALTTRYEGASVVLPEGVEASGVVESFGTLWQPGSGRWDPMRDTATALEAAVLTCR